MIISWVFLLWQRLIFAAPAWVWESGNSRPPESGGRRRGGAGQGWRRRVVGWGSILDRESLEWRGFKIWGESLEGLPFTAHPKVEPDGTLWAFGLNLIPRHALVLYHIGADGSVVKAKGIDPGPIGMVHDFIVTARTRRHPSPSSRRSLKWAGS